MATDLVITITSEDKPGIVERITQVLLEHGANIKDSRMARLGGEFAGIMLVSVAESKVQGLMDSMDRLREKSLTVNAKVTEETAAGYFAGYVPHEILVSGADHEGIVNSIASYLAQQGANIEELSTDVVNAPITGTPLFSMHAIVQVPPSITTARLREKLAQIGQEQAIDIEVKLLGCYRYWP